jgi:imidazolonepropionase
MAHTHPVFAGNRANEFEQRTAGATYRELAARGGGIRSTVRATRNASINELVKTGKHYGEWFLRGGTTTVEAKSGYGLTIEDELKILRAIKRLDEETPLNYVPTFWALTTFPSNTNLAVTCTLISSSTRCCRGWLRKAGRVLRRVL